MRKLKKHLYLTIKILVCALCAGSLFYLGEQYETQKLYIIRDPVIIYSNLTLEKVTKEGLFGIISEAKLENLLKMQEKLPFE